MVTASRAFVCVRPQTYESHEEVEVLSYVFAGRDGLRNTSFGLLDPSGKKLTRGSRSPDMTYGSPEKFTEALLEIGGQYEEKAKPIAALPTLANLRLALNVAAADLRPLVVVRADDEKERKALVAQVAEQAWSSDFLGRAHYLVLGEAETVGELTPEPGVSVVQPDEFGQDGSVVSEAAVDAKPKELAEALKSGLDKFEAEARVHDDHIRQARRLGISWESAMPEAEEKGGSASKRGRGGR